MNSAATAIQFGLLAEQFNVALADNTAITICAIPVGKTCVGMYVAKYLGATGNTIESLNWSIATGSLVVTPQMTSNGSGNGEIIVLFKR